MGIILAGLAGCSFQCDPDLETKTGVDVYQRTGYRIDDAFGKRHGVTVPAPLYFAVRHRERHFASAQSLRKKGVIGGYLGFEFLTREQAAEALYVSTLALPGDTLRARLALIEEHCKSPAFKAHMGGPLCGTATVEHTTIGKERTYPAIRCAIKCTPKDGSELIVNTYVTAPSGTTGILFNAHYFEKVSGIKSLGDLPEKALEGGIAYVLKTFEFSN